MRDLGDALEKAGLVALIERFDTMETIRYLSLDRKINGYKGDQMRPDSLWRVQTAEGRKVIVDLEFNEYQHKYGDFYTDAVRSLFLSL